MQAFFDLMVEVENDRTFGGVRQNQMEAMLKSLGYGAVGFNVSITAPLQKHHACQILLSADGSKYQEGRTQESGGSRLTRVTVSVEDDTQAHSVDPSSPILSGYDLIAVRPLSERVFELCCKSMKIDIISIDLARRLPFHLKTPLINAAIARGLHFEITFAAALRDSSSRRVLFGNALSLVRATRGRNLIISSGAAKAMELRGAMDVINLSSLFGLGHGGKGKACLDRNPAAVVSRAARLRGGSRPATVAAVSKVRPEDRWSIAPQDESDGHMRANMGEEDGEEFLGFGASSGEDDNEEEEAKMEGEDLGGDSAEDKRVGEKRNEFQASEEKPNKKRKDRQS